MARGVNLGQWWLHRDLVVEGTGFNKLKPHERPITLFVSLSLLRPLITKLPLFLLLCFWLLILSLSLQIEFPNCLFLMGKTEEEGMALWSL